LTPTQLSLRWLRGNGYVAEVVERWNPHARVRNDLFGFIDIVALRDDITLGVQTTSNGNVSARVKKIADSPMLPHVREAGWHLEVHGWAKDKSNRWQIRVVDIS
jgi:carbonic anhydrase